MKDESPLKLENVNIDNSKEEIEIKKKPEIPKQETSKAETPILDHVENKTSGSSKHNKLHEEKDVDDIVETEYNKKNRSDGDKKHVYSKRVDIRRQDSKTDRRIRNKDRPAIEIYRPGMGRLSKIKAENDCAEPEPKK